MAAEGGSSGKSTPNWSRMEDGGGSERGSAGKFSETALAVVALQMCVHVSLWNGLGDRSGVSV